MPSLVTISPIASIDVFRFWNILQKDAYVLQMWRQQLKAYVGTQMLHVVNTAYTTTLLRHFCTQSETALTQRYFNIL